MKQYTLLTPNGPSLSETKGLLGGNRRGKIYGQLKCPAALRAIARYPTYKAQPVFFADEATAIACGYRPCFVCMRAEYKAWKAEKDARSP